MHDVPPHILREFLDQARALLDRVEADIAAIQRGSTGPIVTGRITGALRTIRSGAAFLELPALHEAANRAERLLRTIDAATADTARAEVAAIRAIVEATPIPGAAPTKPAAFAPPPAPVATPAPLTTPVAAAAVPNLAPAPAAPAPAPSVRPTPLLPFTKLLNEFRSAIANIAAQHGRDLQTQIRPGEWGDSPVDSSTCTALRTPLLNFVAFAGIAATAGEQTASTPITLAAEPEGVSACLRIILPPASGAGLPELPQSLLASRRTIEAIFGSVETTADGDGRALVVRFPSNSGVLDAMLVCTGEAKDGAPTLRAIPTTQIHRILPAAGSDLPEPGAFGTIMFENASVPVLNVCSPAPASPATRRHILILRIGGKRIGLLVERALGRQELSLQSVDQATGAGGPFRVAAATSDGQKVFVLDAAALATLAARRAAPVLVAAPPQLAVAA